MLKTSNIRSMAQILRDMKNPPLEEDSDKDKPGTQGDKEAYQKKRKEIANKFGVESCSALKDENERKACYAALDAAHVSDDEEEDGEKKEEVQKEAHVKHECPKCKGEGCEHCDGKGYHVEDEDEDPVGKNEEVEIDEKFAGWIAFYGGKKLEIRPKKGEIDSLWDAKKSAIDHFKVPKSKQGLLAIKPAHEEVEIEEMPNRANMEKINSLIKKHSGKFKWRDEVLYVEKGIEKDVTSLIKKGGLTATVKVSSNPMREEVELDESLALQLKMAFSDAKIKMKSKKGKIVIAKRDKKKAMDTLTKVLPSRLKKYVDKAVDNFLVFEEVEIEEKKAATGYELYHKDFSSAMQHAYAHAKKKGVIVDPKEIDDKVATGPKKPSNGKTNRYILGTNSRKKVHIQVANLDNKRYELNMYIESKTFDALEKVRGMIKERSVTQNKFFPKVLMDGIRKVIPGVKLVRHTINHPRSKQTIPGLGLQLPGDKGIRVMVQYDKEDSPAPKGLDKTIVDIDPETGKKEVTDTSLRDGYTVWVNEVGKVWSKGEVKWVQSKDFRDPKKVVQFLKTKVKRMAKEEVVVEREMTDAEKDKREEIVLSLKKKTKDFKERYGDKWKEVMYATATKMAMGEEKDKKESSSKKDKINLKPTMDETMKKYKDLLKGLKEKKSTTEDSDKDTPGTQGDNAEWQKKRSAVLKKFGVKSCAALGTEEEKKACYKALDDAHVADHEEEVKKEQVEVDARKKGYKEAMKRIESRRTKVAEKDKKKKDWYMDDSQEGPAKPKSVKEAVTSGGVEYGEQDFDHGARLDHAAPNLDINMRMAEFAEQGLEGPYLFKGETYFFDRKVNGWYSLSSEDYVDDAMNAELGYHYTRDGGYKKQFSS